MQRLSTLLLGTGLCINQAACTEDVPLPAQETPQELGLPLEQATASSETIDEAHKPGLICPVLGVGAIAIVWTGLWGLNRKIDADQRDYDRRLKEEEQLLRRLVDEGNYDEAREKTKLCHSLDSIIFELAMERQKQASIIDCDSGNLADRLANLRTSQALYRQALRTIEKMQNPNKYYETQRFILDHMLKQKNDFFVNVAFEEICTVAFPDFVAPAQINASPAAFGNLSQLKSKTRYVLVEVGSKYELFVGGGLHAQLVAFALGSSKEMDEDGAYRLNRRGESVILLAAGYLELDPIDGCIYVDGDSLGFPTYLNEVTLGDAEVHGYEISLASDTGLTHARKIIAENFLRGVRVV